MKLKAAEEKQEENSILSFDCTVQKVLLEHKRIYNYHFGWKLLFGRDVELEILISRDENLPEKTILNLLKSITLWRMSFIAMLQLECPSYTKKELLNLLQIENVNLFT